LRGLNHKLENRYLVSEVGVPKDRLSRMLTAFPQLFGLSLDNISTHVDYLLNEVLHHP